MRDERTTNYYAVLELSPTATEAEIKRAWHEHMQVWHPDRFVHSPTLHRKAEARTQLINQAYQTLSDPAARTRYDAARQQTPSGTPPPRTSPSPRPQSTPRARQELRGPQTMLNVTRFSHPKIMVPPFICWSIFMNICLTNLRDSSASLERSDRHLRAGDYAIAEAPDIFCVERRRAEESTRSSRILPTIVHVSLRELEPLLTVPHRFLAHRRDYPIQHRRRAVRPVSQERHGGFPGCADRAIWPSDHPLR